MKHILLALVLCSPAFGQISALVYSPSPTSIAATWTTGSANDSNISCGGKAGIDNGFQTSVTAHEAIVEGLSVTTTYSCFVTSGGVSSSPQNVTTLAAPVRIPVISASNSAPIATIAHGDTSYTFVSNDNITYNTFDDSTGWTGSSSLTGPGSYNMGLFEITNESSLAGSTINGLASYGTAQLFDGTDGPGGVQMNNKQGGLFGMAGNLYIFAGRSNTDGSPQPFYFGNIIMSPDHGATWNNWLTPGTFNANGIEPPVTGGSAGQFQYAVSTYGWATPIRYAADDGTIGYETAGNRIDGADGYVYITFLDGNLWNNSNIYLMRVPRVYIQGTANFQYWVGSTSPTPADFVNDSNWSNSGSSPQAIYTNASLTSWPEVDFIPAINSYVLITFSVSNAATSVMNTIWTFYSAPTPAGPWTLFYTQDNTGCIYPGTGYKCGWYGMTMMHRDLINNTVKRSIPIRILYEGNYGTIPAYILNYSTLTLQTPPPVGLSGVKLSGVKIN